jgi:hypothetical protein
MTTKAIFYHAGRPVCVDAEQMIFNTVDRECFNAETVYLGEEGGGSNEAENSGVRSVPILVVGDQSFYIKSGASPEDLKS